MALSDLCSFILGHYHCSLCCRHYDLLAFSQRAKHTSFGSLMYHLVCILDASSQCHGSTPFSSLQISLHWRDPLWNCPFQYSMFLPRSMIFIALITTLHIGNCPLQLEHTFGEKKFCLAHCCILSI